VQLLTRTCELYVDYMLDLLNFNRNKDNGKIYKI
jgi:hypothetical protein